MVYIDPTRGLVDQDQVRVLIAHEMGHHFSGNHHSQDERDVMHIDVRRDITNFTRADFDRFARWMAPRPGIRPWTDPNPPWLEQSPNPPTEHQWHNEANPYDVNRDGVVNRQDIIDFLATLPSVPVDKSIRPPVQGDIDNDGDMDAVDARRLLRWIMDFQEGA